MEKSCHLSQHAKQKLDEVIATVSPEDAKVIRRAIAFDLLLFEGEANGEEVEFPEDHPLAGGMVDFRGG